MKRTILISGAALIAVLLVFFGAVWVGAASAQDDVPPYGGRDMMRNGQGPLHTFMVVEFAKKLDLNADDINTRLAAGESMYNIALSAGVTAEEFPAVMTEVRTAALEAAVAANVISQEQADQMKLRGFGQGGMDGNCAGQQGQGRHGQNMMRGWQNQQTNP